MIKQLFPPVLNLILVSPRALEKSEPVINTSRVPGGLEYSDCYLYDNDARFVFNFIRGSLNYGCIAANYVESIAAIGIHPL